ncbi:AAA family ATPase [Pedobacter metabolipauper]|uniref:MoxR-like ATPase n=1 Tax=Pedobacter metabolipauper TaxID=425513 RepID=A0A4R6SVM3_9SPHI|nr:MoxR family ATPase [Pedobacter metabolipauper]TDQ09431.1 MoxR-like ATPase [Pedobacter metabolipauper]
MDPVIQSKAFEQMEQEILEEGIFVAGLIASLQKTIVGQEALIRSLLVALFGNGHILLEGVPGLAKTLAVKSLAQSIQAKFNRIQFTPDLLPADVLGTMIYNIQTNEFNIKKGPVFANFILADEINRAPEKVQSALLEVMQEHQVTISNTTYPLEAPFLVLATQNPIDQNGTYELPEAQMDRFMLKVVITYPTLEQERLVMQRNMEPADSSGNAAFSISRILHIQSLVKRIYIDKKIEDYILNIIFCTRFPERYGLEHLKSFIRFGSSPRGSINLALAARVQAFLNKRSFVIPEDVKAIAYDVLRHRIGLTYAAIAEDMTADLVLNQIISAIEMP